MNISFYQQKQESMENDLTAKIMSFLPVITTLSYLYQDKEFSFIKSLPLILPMCVPILTNFPNCKSIGRTFNLFKTAKKPMSYLARINLKYWTEEPDSVVRCFSAVLWHWNGLNKAVNCMNMMEEFVSRSFYYSEESKNEYTQPMFVDDKNTPFWCKDDPTIQYRMWMERSTDREGKESKEIFLQIDFLSTILPSKIVEHIEFIKEEAKRINLLNKRKQRVLVSRQDDSDKEKHGPSFMIYEFNTTSNFDNFFCEEAQIVNKELDYFMKNREEYERIGKPWTYTILNEGPPGVGKTKLVKSIAKKTGYTLIVINLAHIQNAQTLYEAFHISVLGGESVPHDKRLYYIPEVDTQLGDLVKSRDQIQITPDLTGKLKLQSQQKPTLGEILNVLDGVPERHGHILVMDTNHLNDLDPALIRPGRVDRILSWKKLSSSSIKQYLEHYYKKPITIRLPDRKYTAAELQSLVNHKSFAELKTKI
jgi:hypothetical protein